MLLKGAISAVPLSPKQCWLCLIKTWKDNVNTARMKGGGEGVEGGGKMSQFDELLR